MTNLQVLIPDFKRPWCENCQGRGFNVLEIYDPGKECPRSEAVECPDCGGTGAKFKSRD